MRCLSCDRRLSDSESVRKYASSGGFVDLCNRCFAYVSEDIPDLDGDGFEHDYEEEQEAPYNSVGLEGLYGFPTTDEETDDRE